MNLSSLAPAANRVQTDQMPLPLRVCAIIAGLGGAGMILRQILDLRRQRRNLKHWEKDEPLEGDVWD
jgi:hypothetical protein